MSTINKPLHVQHRISGAIRSACVTGKPGLTSQPKHLWNDATNIYPHTILEEGPGFVRAAFSDVQPAKTGREFAGKTVEIRFL